MESILTNILKHIQLSESEQVYVASLVKQQTFEKKEFLQKAGEPCRNIFFVIHGVLRAYFLSKEGKESTIMFATKDWWITDMDSFIHEKIAVVNIQVISSATVVSLSKQQLDGLYREIPAFNKFFRILMQNAYCREQRRSFQTLSLPAKDRYDQFISNYPEVAQSVPQKFIASYLGITPEFLSHLRSQKA